MAEYHDTIVVGGGQAGLSVGFHLARRDCEHVLLEQGEIGDSWRTQRWESFRLNTPNLFLQLPGCVYAGDEPEAFLTCEETIAYLSRYAELVPSPRRLGTRVTSLRPRASGGYTLDTSDGPLEAANVVVATGGFRKAAPRSSIGTPSTEVVELHSSEYRSADQLPEGGVLVVGSGQSGCQIGADLLRSGRGVHLSVGRCPSLPLYYRGRQAGQWLIDLGMMDDTVETLPSPSARLACNPTLQSDVVDHLRGPRQLERDGAQLVGRVEAIDGRRTFIRPDLADRLAESDEFARRFKQRVDELVLSTGLDLPEEPEELPPPVADCTVRELDLRGAGIGTVIWANGFRPDFGWIELPFFDSDGWPVQTRGVSAAPGLYFVGLHWLHKRQSALLLGVGEDAEHVASTIAGR